MKLLSRLSTSQYNFVTDPEQSVFCNALAGTGKSFCLQMRIRYGLDQGWFENKKVLLLCFNSEIEREWRALGLPITTSTSHAMGRKLLAEMLGVYPELDNDKYFDNYNLLVKEAISLSNIRKHTLFNNHDKQTLLRKIEEQLLLDQFDPILLSKSSLKIYNAWRKGLNSLATMINFDDMLYGAFELIAKDKKYKSKIRTQFDYVMIDEYQDFSKFQCKLVELLEPGNINMIGDWNQAIFGWCGSDYKLGLQLAAKFECKEFALTQSRRCPKVIAKYASKYVPEFKAHNSNRQGSICFEDGPDIKGFLHDRSTVIISRSNAPLFNIALTCLEKNIDFQFRNIDRVVTPIINFIRSRTKSNTSLRSANFVFQSYKDARTGVLKRHELNMTNEEVDKFDIVLGLTDPENSRYRTIGALIEGLRSLKEKKNGIEFTSIHQSKGREWQNVVCLDHDILEKTIEKDGKICPESEPMNLAFVSTTRSKNNMIFRSSKMVQEYFNNYGNDKGAS